MPAGCGRFGAVGAWALIGWLGLMAWPLPAQADRVFLRGGGQIRGKLIAVPNDPTRWTFVGERGKNPIVYTKAQIVEVVTEPSALDEYAVRRARERTTAEDEFQLGSWAEDHKYPDLAQYHYEGALRLDSQYAPAHEKLGHALVGDRWLNADEQREAQGLVKHRGHWITQEEKDRIDDQAALAQESAGWTKRVKGWREALANGPPARAQEAEARLLAIREPLAIRSVAQILGGDADPAIRALAGRTLGAIPGADAGSALVTRMLAETDDAVRVALVPELARRDADEVVPRLVRALKSKQPMTINRAAWTLGQLDARSAVPHLIPALTATEYRTQMVPVNTGGGGGIAAGGNAGGAEGGPSFNSGTGGTYLGLTGPVVGPGVVAFGATGVPYGSGVSLGSGGATTGTGMAMGGGGGVKYLPQVVTIQHPNVEVLAALSRLTGQNFGYDASQWRRWVAASFRSDPAPSRRVVNP